MNLFDSSFLCLDIGTSCVRGIAHKIKSGRIDKSAVFSTESYDTVFALKSVIDELERQIGTRFDSAFVTGNFGDAHFEMAAKSTVWNGEHKITASDVRSQIASLTPPDGFYPMHIIPLRYDTPGARNILTPVGHTDRQLISAFSAIFYSTTRMDEIHGNLRRAHIQADAFYDPHFLQNATMRQQKKNTLFVDIGAQYTTASVWTDRGPVWHAKFPGAGTAMTTEISEKLHLDFDEADRIKRNAASLIPNEMDRFTPADTAYEFSRGDVKDIVTPHMVDIIAQIKNSATPVITKYPLHQILLSGGGAEIEGAVDFFENAFGIPAQNMHGDASVRALSDFIWASQSTRRAAYNARHAKWARRIDAVKSIFRRRPPRRTKFMPILPSTLCFNMKNQSTYSLFKSGDISMIHVDIMDGFYVDRVAGGIDQLKYIRAHTDAHLHVHLMTESPAVWAADAVAAGADTIILSTNTSGLRAGLRAVRAAGRRVGVALNPDSSVAILKPVLREVDEVMIMAVAPGAAGQAFNPACLHKISVLAATRKKYGLKFTISVDGGINDKTAQLCWDAGADLLVSGSYLAHSSDFPLAVQSLLKKSEN